MACVTAYSSSCFRRLANLLHVDIYAYDSSSFRMRTGHASEENMYYDIEAVYNHILSPRGINFRVSDIAST